MIENKAFYSMVQENNIVGLRRQDGHEITVSGIKFNAYESTVDGMVYILDPKNGISIFEYRDCTDTLPHHELIERAKDEFIEQGFFEKWKGLRGTASYLMANKVFKAYRKAESLRERQRELAQRQIGQDRGQGSNENETNTI